METTTRTDATLVLSRTIAAPPETAFRYWTDPALLARWFAPTDEHAVEVHELDVRPGGSYRISMLHHRGAVHTLSGEFRDVEDGKRLVFTWEWEGADAAMPIAGETLVTVEFDAKDAGTELRVVHALQNDESVGAHTDGWDGCLWRLGNQFEAGRGAAWSRVLALHRLMLENGLDDLAEGDLDRRVAPDTNTVRWVAGHLANTRGFMGSLLGADVDTTAVEVFQSAVPADAEVPDLEAIMGTFRAITHGLLVSLRHVSPTQLAAPAPMEWPLGDGTIGGLVDFLVSHEAYHLGQLGLLRKGLGYDALSYTPHFAESEVA